MVNGQFIIGYPRIYMHETFHEVGFHMSTLTSHEANPKAAYSIQSINSYVQYRAYGKKYLCEVIT
jgi:hypothetical protein